MNNETNYDGRTILRWIRACFRGYAAQFKKLRIRVSYGRGSLCRGSASRGGWQFHLTLPRKPENLTAADLSFVVNYLYLIHHGIRRREMTMAQKMPGVREWHMDLPLPTLRPVQSKAKPTAAEKRKVGVDRRARHAKNMLAKYDLLEAATARELLRLGALKKKWQDKVTYYEKRGVS